MSLRLPPPSNEYDAEAERTRNLRLEQEDKRNRKKRADLELVDERLILRSPDGSRFRITVENNGTVTTQAL